MNKKLTDTQRRELLNLVGEQDDVKLARWFIAHDLNPHNYLRCLLELNSEFDEPYGSVAIQLSIWRNELDKDADHDYDAGCGVRPSREGHADN